MATNCPSVPFGIPEGGATEYDINTGRELFRCGDSCVKMYLTNVSGERRIVKIGCGSISDAVVNNGAMCLQSANVNYRGQAIVNWGAKPNVTSSLESGSVITRVMPCGTNEGIIYTHTEGNLSIRVLSPVANLTDKTSSDAAKNTALAKFNDATANAMKWILSDIGVNVSPTDWQGGTVTYMGFKDGGDNRTFRGTFNWQNGRMETGEGTLTYDNTDDTTPENVFAHVLGI